jgi:hypothetical protein
MPRYSILLIIILLFGLNLSKAEDINSPSSNFDVVDRLVKEGADELKAKLTNRDVDSLYLKINMHQAQDYMLQRLVASLDSQKIYTRLQNPDLPELSIFINEISTAYSLNDPESELINRKVVVEYSAVLIINNQAMKLQEYKREFSDKLTYDQAAKANSQDFPFANSTIPEEPTTFFEDLVEPIIVTGAIVITSILLFTVRSN